jgi:hypothetical protein
MNIKSWLNSKNISKKDLLLKWHTSFWFYKSQGANMTGNYKSLIQNVGSWGVIFAILFKFDLTRIGKWVVILVIIDVLGDILVGWLRVKYQIIRYESNFVSKNGNINPCFREQMETDREICKALGVKDHYTEI